jgi:ATP-dependent Lon protease
MSYEHTSDFQKYSITIDTSMKRPHEEDLRQQPLPKRSCRIQACEIFADSFDSPNGPDGPDENEQEYRRFFATLPQTEQQKLKELEQEIIVFSNENIKPLKYQILTSSAPIKIKCLMMNKFKRLMACEKNSNDYTYESTTLEHILKIPWGIFRELPVLSTESSLHGFLTQTGMLLDSVTFGQRHAKSKLMLEVSRYLQNPREQGFVLGLKGSPGTGKTTLISKGLSQILNRPFFRVDLGGAKHSDSLFGTRKVFERSDVGDLTKFLIEGQCLNPIIFFDELDKISVTEYGNELVNALNDLTDTNRNQAIVDQYLGIPLDLSRAVIVFAYNDSSVLQETLRNRIHEIEIEPYTLEDKVAIVKKFFLPRARSKLNIQYKTRFANTAIKTIILEYTNHESGVRELERRIDEIILKINWIKMASKKPINCFNQKMTTINPRHLFPIDTKIVRDLLT